MSSDADAATTITLEAPQNSLPGDLLFRLSLLGQTWTSAVEVCWQEYSPAASHYTGIDGSIFGP
jgi:hypothetical protein